MRPETISIESSLESEPSAADLSLAPRSGRRLHCVVALTCSAFALTSCQGGSVPSPIGEASGASEPRSDATAAPAVAGVPDFSDVVERVLPSIVFIQTEGIPLKGMLPPGVQRPDMVPIGLGSGVVISTEGHILTNNHVVQDAARVLVVLHDRRYFEAEVVGRDPSTEVAIVRIEASDLRPARLGDSDQVALGDAVLAMGSPLGLQFSVTAGIVSGTGRMLGILQPQDDGEQGPIAPLEHFIQTDAALSPGNSGGPLVNQAGEVIGINTAVAGGGPIPVGFGFSIPSNLARSVSEQLIRRGEVRRPYLGIAFRNVSPTLARQNGLERVEGAVAVRVEEDGPAARGGVLPGDVVLQLGDVPVQTVSDLQAELATLQPGSHLTLHVLRERKRVALNVELGQVRSGVTD